MEKHEYEDDAIPQHVAHFLRQQARERASKLIEKQELTLPIYANIPMQQLPSDYLWYTP